MDDLTPLVALGAGIVSFVSPCVLPLVPVYVGNLAACAAEGAALKHSRRRAVLHSAVFVLGFSTVFVSLGAVVGLLGWFGGGYNVLLRRIAGGVLILFGVYATGLLRLPFLYREARLSLGSGKAPGYPRSFMVGVAFALGWTPCVGPVLGGILALAWSSQTVWEGVSLLSVYSLGLGIPFLAVSLALAPATRVLGAINRHARLISMVAGILMVILGLLMLTDQLNRLTGLLTP